MKTSRALALLTLLACMVFGRFAAAQACSVTDLGSLDGVPTDATSVKDDGAICDNPAARGLARTTAPTQPRWSQ